MLCKELGIPVMPAKVAGPTTLLDFLGLLINTIKMEISLPEDKLRCLKSLLSSWLGRKSCTKRQLQSLIGHLHHASKVIKPGRPFIRRMIDLASSRPHPESMVCLNVEFRSDLQWWITFLEKWNGISIISALCRRPVDMVLTTDASGNWGCGGYFNRQWFQLPWNGYWQHMPIAVKELLPVVISCIIWGKQMRGLHVHCRCDNAAVIVMVNKGTSKNGVAAHLLRCLSFVAATFQFSLSASHLPGVENVAADSLSRDDLPRFHSTVDALPAPSPVPDKLFNCMLISMPDWLSQEWISVFRSFL